MSDTQDRGMGKWIKTKRIHKEGRCSFTNCVLDSIFITGLIEAIENQDVAIIDLPSAFLHADLEDDDQFLIGCGR